MNQDTILVAGLSVNTLAVVAIAARGGWLLGSMKTTLDTISVEVTRLRDAVEAIQQGHAGRRHGEHN